MDLPEPVLPTIAVVCPELIVKSTLFNTSKLSTYAKVTFSNVIFLSSLLNSFVPFLISGVSF